MLCFSCLDIWLTVVGGVLVLLHPHPQHKLHVASLIVFTIEVASLSLLQEWLSEAELGQSFDEYDADHSGDISFDEFEHMVRLVFYPNIIR